MKEMMMHIFNEVINIVRSQEIEGDRKEIQQLLQIIKNFEKKSPS